MEKDGFLTVKSGDEYAKLLASGFTTGPVTKGNHASTSWPSYSLLRSAAMWAHKGDLVVREALAMCEIGRCR